MKPASYGAKVCRNPDLALTKEWQEKNELGAYAASSILGTNTKPAHGLLVTPCQSPIHEAVLLANLDETLYIGERPFPLSTHVYHDTVFPKGYESLEHFYRLPFPTWVFRLDGLALVKMVILIHGENTVLIRYQLLSSYGDYVRLQIRPVTAFRSTSKLIRENTSAIPKIHASQQGVIELKSPNACPSLYLFHNAAVVDRTGIWLRRLKYAAEKSEGPQEEDLYSPCSFLYAFLKEDGVYLSVSTNSTRKFDPFLIGIKEKRRRRSVSPNQPNRIDFGVT